MFVDVPSSLTSDLRLWMIELRSAIKTLNTYLTDHCELRCASVFELPRIHKDDALKPYKELPVNVINEPFDAFIKAKNAFLNFYGQGEESTQSVFRLPGHIVVTPENFITLMKLVDKVNFIKLKYDRIMAPITDEDQRWEIKRACFPMFIVKQATRPIVLVNGGLRSISYTWAHKTSIYKLKKENVIGRLETARKYPNAKLIERGMTWDEVINREIETIQSYPDDTPFRQRFKNKVRPIANLRFTGGLKRQRAASMPVIIWNPDPNKFIQRNLKSFVSKETPHIQQKNAVLDHYKIYLHETEEEIPNARNQ